MRTTEEIIENIKHVLEEKVAPSVAQHNGAINFISFDDGVARLKLSGSCSGCAMSQITLQRGVENMLKHYVPEVQAIVGEDDDKAKEQGYSPYMPRDVEPDWKTKDVDEPWLNEKTCEYQITIVTNEVSLIPVSNATDSEANEYVQNIFDEYKNEAIDGILVYFEKENSEANILALAPLVKY